MKNIFKIYFLTFILLSDFMAFAQPGDDTGGGDLEDPEPAAPINSKLILLLIVGLIFDFYKIKKHRRIS